MQTLHAGAGYLTQAAASATRLPTGHPEGFIEAFANIYRDFAAAIREGRPAPIVPGIIEGVRGLAFVEQAVLSSREGSTWVSLQEFA